MFRLWIQWFLRLCSTPGVQIICNSKTQNCKDYQSVLEERFCVRGKMVMTFLYMRKPVSGCSINEQDHSHDFIWMPNMNEFPILLVTQLTSSTMVCCNAPDGARETSSELFLADNPLCWPLWASKWPAEASESHLWFLDTNRKLTVNQ